MKLQNLSEEKDCCEYEWEDLDYGDVCEFSADELTFIGMKVEFDGEDLVLDLEDSAVYSDVEGYKIVKVFNNVTLIYDSEDTF